MMFELMQGTNSQERPDRPCIESVVLMNGVVDLYCTMTSYLEGYV